MKSLLTGFLAVLWLSLQAQQLYLEGFGSINRTRYSDARFSNATDYLGYGGRLAVGSDHFQVGAEYRSNLTNPKFDEPFGTTSFDETFYGGFLRTKISRYPAMRFGLVLRAGGGVYATSAHLDTNPGKYTQKYDPIFGFNGGAGFSIPILNHTMIELGYTYNYLKRPSGVFTIPAHNASYHLISVGLSLNFVFGKRAREYDHLKKNWKYRNGWRD